MCCSWETQTLPWVPLLLSALLPQPRCLLCPCPRWHPGHTQGAGMCVPARRQVQGHGTMTPAPPLPRSAALPGPHPPRTQPPNPRALLILLTIHSTGKPRGRKMLLSLPFPSWMVSPCKASTSLLGSAQVWPSSPGQLLALHQLDFLPAPRSAQ